MKIVDQHGKRFKISASEIAESAVLAHFGMSGTHALLAFSDGSYARLDSPDADPKPASAFQIEELRRSCGVTAERTLVFRRPSPFAATTK